MKSYWFERKVLPVIGIIIVAAALAYFFWPKTVTKCGMLPDGDGGVRSSCQTCTCKWGVPSGFSAPECFLGKAVDCRVGND